MLDELGAAAERAAEMAAAGHELHFERDRATGRVVAALRELRAGEVIATMSLAMALDVVSPGRPGLRAPRSRRRT